MFPLSLFASIYITFLWTWWFEEEKEESKGEADRYAKGAGGLEDKPKILKAVTDDSYKRTTESLLDDSNKG